MKNIKGAIFDVDGTMLDTEPVWTKVPVDYLISRGKTLKPDLLESLRGLGGHQIPGYFRREYGVTESEEEIHNAINALLEDFYFNHACLKDGVFSVLEQLKQRDIKMCVATATDRYLVEAALKRCGILGYFGRVFTCVEENTSKREPDIFIKAARFLGTEVEETIVFEDALYAIKSAKNAGFIVAAVFDLAAEEDFTEITALADYYYESLAGYKIE